MVQGRPDMHIVVQAEKLQTALSLRLLQQQEKCVESSSGSIESSIGSSLQGLVDHIQTSWGVRLRSKAALPAVQNAGSEKEACEQPANGGIPTGPLVNPAA